MLNDSIAISWDTVLPLIVPLIVLIQKSMQVKAKTKQNKKKTKKKTNDLNLVTIQALVIITPHCSSTIGDCQAENLLKSVFGYFTKPTQKTINDK